MAVRRAVTEELVGRAAIGVLFHEIVEPGLSELPFLAAEAASRDDAIDATIDERLGNLRCEIAGIERHSLEREGEMVKNVVQTLRIDGTVMYVPWSVVRIDDEVISCVVGRIG